LELNREAAETYKHTYIHREREKERERERNRNSKSNRMTETKIFLKDMTREIVGLAYQVHSMQSRPPDGKELHWHEAFTFRQNCLCLPGKPQS
jgi:hypothetical protein